MNFFVFSEKNIYFILAFFSFFSYPCTGGNQHSRILHEILRRNRCFQEKNVVVVAVPRSIKERAIRSSGPRVDHMKITFAAPKLPKLSRIQFY